MTLMEKLVEAGYPKEDFFHHYSDLYVYATPMTQRVINDWFHEQQMDRTLFVSQFRDQITGKPMFDIAFQYTPYWEGKWWCRCPNSQGKQNFNLQKGEPKEEDQ